LTKNLGLIRYSYNIGGYNMMKDIDVKLISKTGKILGKANISFQGGIPCRDIEIQGRKFELVVSGGNVTPIYQEK
jgi:hypothetical protein